MSVAPNPKHIALARRLPRQLLSFLEKYPQPLTEAWKAAQNTTEHTNPFLPFKNPATSKWRPASYSLPQQSMLYKLAAKHGVKALLPEQSPKNPEVRLKKRMEEGLRVRGTGVGKKVKGHAWERQLSNKLAVREKAMQNMPELIKEWKIKGHGRRWKKWPK